VRAARQCAAAATIDRRRDWLRGAPGPQDGALAPRPPPLSLTLRPAAAAAFACAAWVSTVLCCVNERGEAGADCMPDDSSLCGAAESLHGGAPRRQGHRRSRPAAISPLFFLKFFCPIGFLLDFRVVSWIPTGVLGESGLLTWLCGGSHIDFLHTLVKVC
jgi:hypothetical protein